MKKTTQRIRCQKNCTARFVAKRLGDCFAAFLDAVEEQLGEIPREILDAYRLSPLFGKHYPMDHARAQREFAEHKAKEGRSSP